MEKTAGIRRENKENADGEQHGMPLSAPCFSIRTIQNTIRTQNINGMPLKEDRIGHRLLSNTV